VLFFNSQAHRVARLQRIAANTAQAISGEPPILVTRRRVHVNASKSHCRGYFQNGGIQHFKLGAAFFQKDAAGSVVVALLVVRTAVPNTYLLDVHLAGRAHENGIVGDIRQLDLFDSQSLNVGGKDSVARIEPGEGDDWREGVRPAWPGR